MMRRGSTENGRAAKGFGWKAGCAVLLALGLAANMLPVAGEPAMAQGTLTPAQKLLEQVRIAIQHATFSLNSAEMNSRLTHAHHVVNILEGTQGPNFDGSKGNPGDGYGALHYAADAADSGDEILRALAGNALTYLRWARDEAVRATRASDYAAAGEAIHRALAYLSAGLGRTGEEGPIASALALADAQERQGESNTVTIQIYGFRFGDGQPLRIKAGTTVTWINHDTAPHTATGSAFDSGTLNHGDTYSFTFVEPGVYEYICVFHPGMTHTIIVA